MQVKITPKPRVAPKMIALTPSRALLTKRIELSPVSPSLIEPMIDIAPTQKRTVPLMNPEANPFALNLFSILLQNRLKRSSSFSSSPINVPTTRNTTSRSSPLLDILPSSTVNIFAITPFMPMIKPLKIWYRTISARKKMQAVYGKKNIINN